MINTNLKINIMERKEMKTIENIQKQLITFLFIILALSIIIYCLYFASSSKNMGLFGLGIMWVPGFAAIATRLIYQRNLRNFGWGWGKTRYQVISYVLPFVFCLVVYGIVWLIRLGGISTENFVNNLNRSILGLDEPLSFGISLAIMATVGLLIGSISVLGEEIGWRGFFVPELAKITSYSKTSFIVGAIWAVWHIPGILFMGYNSGSPAWYAIPCFILMILGLSFLMTWLRLKSGSLWTAVIIHASHNLFIQGIFDPLTTDTGVTKYITTEFGIGLAVVYIIAAYFFWKKRFKLS